MGDPVGKELPTQTPSLGSVRPRESGQQKRVWGNPFFEPNLGNRGRVGGRYSLRGDSKLRCYVFVFGRGKGTEGEGPYFNKGSGCQKKADGTRLGKLGNLNFRWAGELSRTAWKGRETIPEPSVPFSRFGERRELENTTGEEKYSCLAFPLRRGIWYMTRSLCGEGRKEARKVKTKPPNVTGLSRLGQGGGVGWINEKNVQYALYVCPLPPN